MKIKCNLHTIFQAKLVKYSNYQTISRLSRHFQTLVKFQAILPEVSNLHYPFNFANISPTLCPFSSKYLPASRYVIIGSLID